MTDDITRGGEPLPDDGSTGQPERPPSEGQDRFVPPPEPPEDAPGAGMPAAAPPEAVVPPAYPTQPAPSAHVPHPPQPYDPYAQQQYDYAQQDGSAYGLPQPEKKSRVLLVVLIVGALLACCALTVAGGLLARQAISGKEGPSGPVTGSEDSASDTSTTSDTGVSEETDGASDAGETETGPSKDDSFAVLVRHYDRLDDLDSKIASFARGDFNDRIGNGSNSLTRRASDLLDEVQTDRDELAEADVHADHESQREGLLDLYDLCVARADAMQQAASAAEIDRSRSYWQPYLQPRSGKAKKRFDRLYPRAEPDR